MVLPKALRRRFSMLVLLFSKTENSANRKYNSNASPNLAIRILQILGRQHETRETHHNHHHSHGLIHQDFNIIIKYGIEDSQASSASTLLQS